jgi:hypothetical protein
MQLFTYKTLGMTNVKTHFQEGTRHILVVEEAPDMDTACTQADEFLKVESSADEGGACFLRAKASGIKRGENYYFKVVAVAEPDNPMA